MAVFDSATEVGRRVGGETMRGANTIILTRNVVQSSWGEIFTAGETLL